MGWDGSGNYSRVMDWTDDATAGVKIKSDRHDLNDDDIAAALSNCITKDGQSQPTNDIPMNGKKIINLADPANPTDAANKKYVDAIKTFATNLDLSGADANGRINFTSATGANGLTFTGADFSWLARLAEAAVVGPPAVAAKPARLVLNNKADGTGADVIEMRRDGTSLLGTIATVKGTSAKFEIIPTTGNGHIYWMAADGITTRAILYTSGGAQGHLIASVNGQTYQFGSDGNFFVGASYHSVNGNIIGAIWGNWGAQDAYSAISARIESRAQAWAQSLANNCLQQMRSAGYTEFNHTSGQAGVRATYSGYYMVMSLRIAGDNYAFGFRQIQHWTPAGGWVQSTVW